MKNKKQTEYQRRFFDKRNRLISIIALAIITVFIALSLTSCITQKRVAKICQTCPTEIKDSIRIVEKETVVYKAGALDSLMWVSTFDFSKFTDTVFKTDTLIKFKDNTWQISLVRNDLNQLKLFATHQADSIKELQKIVDNTQVKTVTKTVEKIVPKRDGWYYFLLCWWVVSIVVIIVWFWWQYQNGKIKWLAKFGI